MGPYISPRWSILPAICLDEGVFHVNIVEGAFNAITYRAFISGLLDRMNQYPGPKSVIIMDNASIHHSAETLQMILERYVPPTHFTSSIDSQNVYRGMRYVFLP